jgi:serine/threonine-protein kinase
MRMAEPSQALQASLAGRYDVERVLGEGGMATVYVANDVRHGRKVAIKVMRPEVAISLGQRTAFLPRSSSPQSCNIHTFSA